MKTIEELLKQEPVFLEEFKNQEQVFSEFDAKDLITTERVLFAAYTNYSYEGEAYVLFERKGKLYEVFAYYCSCCSSYELEGQWSEKEVILIDLENKLHDDSFASDYKEELCEFLGVKLNS